MDEDVERRHVIRTVYRFVTPHVGIDYDEGLAIIVDARHIGTAKVWGDVFDYGHGD